jgi:sporulation protein YlmC with PRC-barrel domain
MSDAHLTTRNSAEDIRRRKVVDAAGREIGEIDALLIDEEEKKVRVLHVASGGFLGMSKSKVLIPVESICKIDQHVVHVDQTHERVAAALEYAPEPVDDPYYDGLYGYYGYSPFWAAGYIYPSYPCYPGANRREPDRGERHRSPSARK